jgi:hypothetical protein
VTGRPPQAKRKQCEGERKNRKLGGGKKIKATRWWEQQLNLTTNKEKEKK